MPELNNEACGDLAKAALARGDHKTAMRWFNTAAARTIGHSKTEMWEREAMRAAEAGGFPYVRNDYAKDSEA